MLHQVMVSKSYHHRRLDGEVTVYGTIEVDAKDFENAKDKVEEMMHRGPKVLQACDPSIQWEEVAKKLLDQGWEYSDWSFCICEESPESLGEFGMFGKYAPANEASIAN